MSPDESVAESTRVARTRVVRSEQLFGQGRELIIKHGEEEYRLRITRADKLILTK